MIRCVRRVVLSGVSAVVCVCAGCAGPGFGGATSADRAGLARSGLERAVRIPDRIFTPDMVALIKTGKPYSDLFRHTTGGWSGAGWLERISVSRWRELISPFAPVSATGGSFGSDRRGTCPFCGKPFEGCSMSEEEFFSTPFQAQAECCGHTVFARDEDMPSDYPATPNHTQAIPHLDGTVHDYRFYVPAGSEENRKNWFCSEGEVWRARLKRLVYGVFVYSSAVFNDNDEKAALHLAAIFDRLADVFPGYPLYDSTMAHGFALGRDGKSYLTREEYLSVPRPQRFGKPFWYRQAWHFDKIPTIFAGWQDGVMGQAGVFAASFDIIRDCPGVRAWSASRYGSPDAFEGRVMEHVFKEYLLLCNSVGNTRKNTVMTWVRGAVKLGILMRDECLIQEALRLIEANVANHYLSDGLSTEGAFNYAAMKRSLLDNLWIVEHFGGVDLNLEYPFLAQIRTLGDYPILTLYNVESMHGDEHAHFFASAQKHLQPPEPGSVDYAAHAVSLCFPESGLGCVRAGAPGSRLEMIMDFQSVPGHTHRGKLNLQLFYEGVNLLPDLGYGTRLADLSKAPWRDYRYYFEVLPTGLAPVRDNYNYQPQTHCTALIDGVNHKAGPATFHRFMGGQRVGDPGYAVQFLEADARAVFDNELVSVYNTGSVPDWLHYSVSGQVSRFRRQVFTLTLDNGRAIALDIFRLKGGRTHDLYWHLPADTPHTSLGVPEELASRTVQDYMRSAHPERPAETVSRTDAALQFLAKPKRWQMPDGVWWAEWLIQPSTFEPTSPEGRERYEQWSRLLHDVRLRVWGAAVGGGVESGEIVSARGPWLSGMAEEHPRGKVIALKDALDFFIESRSAGKEPLESTFIHVLEPYNSDQGPALAAVDVLAGKTNKAAAGCAVRLRLKTERSADETRELLVATTVDGGAFRGRDIHLRGRLGMACAEGLGLVLYDGTELRTEHVGVALAPGWRLKLVDVIGDLTGHPGEGALVVDCSRALPVDGTLAGQMLTVYHRISDVHTNGYTIERVGRLRRRRYRIDLRGNPTFIQNRMFVRQLDSDNPRHVYGTTWLYKGNGLGLYRGRRIRFPRTGFTCAIRQPLFVVKSGLDLLELAATPGEDDVRVGDPMIVYSIQPGDTVVIPSLFAVRAAKREARGRVDLRIFTTGTATLRLPDRYEVSSLVSAGEAARFSARTGKGELAITIEHSALRDGRAVLSLNAGTTVAGLPR